MLAQLGALLKEVVGPLAKAAAEDWCKDRLKDGANEALALSAPDALQKAVKQSLRNFIRLFGDELENCGLPRALIKHELAEPLGRLLATESVVRALCRAFETGVKEIDWQVLPSVWRTLPAPANFPEEFEWEELARNYVRRVKGLVRQDAELARQLELDQQRAIKESNEALVGVPVQFNLREYQESLKERFGSLSLDSLDTAGSGYDSLRLWKIFVAQDVRECAEFAPQMYELPKERLLALQAAGEIDPLLSLDELEQRRRSYAEKPIESVRGVVGLAGSDKVLRSVILGDPGSGKSTLLRALALSWADKPLAALRDEPIPILIELRLYAQDKEKGICNSFLEYLHRGNTACRLNQLELDALLKGGKAVALFDGVDEVFDPKLREAVVTDIHRFSNRYPAVQMVVTSRWLGYKAEALRKAEFAHYMLQDLNDEQIEDFLERWHTSTFTKEQQADRERKQARLQKAIAASKAIRELAGNPLLLTMMAILNLNQDLPRDRARLYEEASEILLHKWDDDKNLSQEDLEYWQIDFRDKRVMMRRVAHHMQTNKKGVLGNVIGRDDLEEILTGYLKEIDVIGARRVARLMIKQLRKRNFILCHLGADNYTFVHRTFLEYFCASELVHQFEKERSIDIEELKAIYGKHFLDEAWNEVLRLIAGLVGPCFVEKIIEHLLSQSVLLTDFLEKDQLTVGGISNLLLAAGCLAEVRTRSEVSQVSELLKDRLKHQVEVEYPYRLSSEAAKDLLMSIAYNWKEDISVKEWLIDCASRASSLSISEAAIRVVSLVWKEDLRTLAWLKMHAQKNEIESVRIAAVQCFARNWKKDLETLPWLKARAQEDESLSVCHAMVQEIARGWNEDPKILLWLKTCAQKNENSDVRSAAIQELARNWKEDSETLQMLKEYAQDGNVDVRSAAIQGLARDWKEDPETLQILKECARNDEDWWVRVPAIEELARGWREDPETLQILKECAQERKIAYVRGVAVKELARGWREEKETLQLLKACAQDKDWDVYITALQELARGWKEDPETLRILKARTHKDEDGAACVTALKELARGWKEDPKTLQLLKRCACDNENWAVRFSALQELAKGWGDDIGLFEFWLRRASNDPFVKEHGHENNPRKVALYVFIQQYPNHPLSTELLYDRAQNDTDEKLRTWATEQLSRLAL